MNLDVENSGVPALLGDNFELSYETIVDPASTVDMPERPAIPCHFKLVDAGSSRTIAKFEQLHHAAESGNVADFGSPLFAMPKGTTVVAISNLGCRSDYAFAGGVARIGPIGEHLLVPIAAFGLAILGILTIVLGLGIFIWRSIKAKRPLAES